MAPPKTMTEEQTSLPAATPPAATQCSFCGEHMPSKNALFRHLRFGESKCAEFVQQQGGIQFAGKHAPSKSDSLKHMVTQRLMDKKPKEVDSASTVEKVSPESSSTVRLGCQSTLAKRKKKNRESFTNALDAELWMSEIPQKYASVRILRKLLWEAIRKGEEIFPHVKKLMKRGYRAAAETEIESPQPSDGHLADARRKNRHDRKREMNKRPWIATAFLAFRTKEEAEAALEKLNGRRLADDFTIVLKRRERRAKARVKADVKDDTSAEKDDDTANEENVTALQPGELPSLLDQQMALPMEELVNRCERVKKWLESDNLLKEVSETFNTYISEMVPNEKKLTQKKENPKLPLAKALASVHETVGREVRHIKGALLPEELAIRVTEEMAKVVWPVKKHRANRNIDSQHYSVVWRGRPRSEFREVYPLMERVAEFGEEMSGKLVHWTHIAVTKNFIGSPHIDELDQTPQLVASFGQFGSSGDGQLCVEDWIDGSSPKSILYRCETRNRVAKVDGRFVHFVSGYTGVRYSLVFYCLDREKFVQKGRAVLMPKE